LIDYLMDLPSYLKYVAMTLVPWVELRGAVPLAVQQSEQLYLPIVLIVNWLIFFPTYFILDFVYEHIPHGSWLHRKLERIREKGHKLVERWGLFGLVLFVAIPLPGTGAYSGSCAAWLLDIDWKHAALAVAAGVCIAFAVMWGFSEAAAAGLSLL